MFDLELTFCYCNKKLKIVIHTHAIHTFFSHIRLADFFVY